jgi:hypothetical protein
MQSVVFVALPIRMVSFLGVRCAAGTAGFVSSVAINSVRVSLLSAPFSDHRPRVRPRRVWLTRTLPTATFTWRWRVSALMPWPVSTAVCLMAGSTLPRVSNALFLVAAGICVMGGSTVGRWLRVSTHCFPCCCWLSSLAATPVLPVPGAAAGDRGVFDAVHAGTDSVCPARNPGRGRSHVAAAHLTVTGHHASLFACNLQAGAAVGVFLCIPSIPMY